MESQPQKAEFGNNPENFHPYIKQINESMGKEIYIKLKTSIPIL